MARKAKDLSELNKILPKFGDVVRGRKRARLRSMGGNQTPVYLEWDLNQDSIQDQVFKMRIGDQEAYIDYEEFLHFARDF